MATKDFDFENVSVQFITQSEFSWSKLKETPEQCLKSI